MQNNQTNSDIIIEDRHINVSQFLEARSSEIGYFTQQLNSKKNGSNKLAYQMVKKHLRRRAMSHNRYRIPSRIRNRMNVQELDVIEKTQDPIKCRKHLRKPKLLMNSYIRRSRSDKWMETHLWHAKRMRMIKYFQYKIARTPNEKGDRACFRFANHDCTVYDRSYYEFIFIQGTKMLEFMNAHLQQKDYKTLVQNQKKNFKITDNLDVYKNELNTLIGPAKFIWKTEQELVVFIHPGCVPEWIQILTLYAKKFENQMDEPKESLLNFQHIKDNYNIFDLSGPLCLYKVHYLLANLGLSEEQINNIHPLVRHFKNVNDAANYPRNHIIQLQFQANVSKKLIKPPFDFSQVCVEENPLNQDLLNQSLVDLITYSKEVKQENISLLENIKEIKQRDYVVRFKTVTRNRYTHKKKNKISKKQKTNALSQVKIEEKKKYEDQKQQQQQQQQQLNQTEQSQQESKIEAEEVEPQSNNSIQLEEIKFAKDLVESDIHLMIVFNNSRQHKAFGQGVTLVVNQGRGILVWRLLSFIACKAIGLNEYNNIIEESGQKVFPNDYPLTQAYSTLNRELLETKVTKHFLRPQGKRVNYMKINSPFPFKPNFDYVLSKYLESEDKIVAQQEDLQDVRVIMVGRGKPDTNSYICLPEAEDFIKYQEMLKKDKSRVYSIHDEPTYVKVNNKQIDIPEPSQISTTRKIIGFLSFGDFSFKSGVGKGRGQIIKYYLDALKAKSQVNNMEIEDKQCNKQSNEIFCLIRNPTSRKYYLANLYLI
ncbi:hypothetical protein ABPG74_007658 [Tetrahymena malaccensis]